MTVKTWMILSGVVVLRREKARRREEWRVARREVFCTGGNGGSDGFKRCWEDLGGVGRESERERER